MPQPGENGTDAPQMVWVKEGTNIHPVPIKIGLDDDINAEILNGIKAGQEVVLSMEQKIDDKKEARSGGNPFMPGPPGR
ncbi:hypothetical protein OU798_22070 [Prolixibacteraceae bacterium Z1-6]|uniref:Uncharacterized protein n=1 Tax=Draconibacterium aestuarii TaxID=2998507 RepID=A0A9X3F9L2_9BACT|nr:hypothetical protein [Prolixibacteraceae bacterium Z1-6]